MEFITKTVVAITNKPSIAFTITQSAFMVSLLAWVNVVTPILGLIAATFGVVVGWYSMRTAIRKWKETKKHKIYPKK